MNVLFAAWGVILAAFAIVTVRRWQFAKREDDHLHFRESDQQLVAVQSAVAHKLDVLDRVKTSLLILFVVTGLAILGLHAYHVWQQGAGVI